jgi:hypothetical protein
MKHEGEGQPRPWIGYGPQAKEHTSSTVLLLTHLTFTADKCCKRLCLQHLGFVHIFRFSTGRELIGLARAQLGTSFIRPGFRRAGSFRLSPDKVVEHRKA